MLPPEKKIPWHFLWYLQNGRRHLISSRNEVSRDLIVTKSSKKKQMLQVLSGFWTIYNHSIILHNLLNQLVNWNFYFPDDIPFCYILLIMMEVSFWTYDIISNIVFLFLFQYILEINSSCANVVRGRPKL